MSVVYFDCFAGAAGDMIVAALIDAGGDFPALQTELKKLPLSVKTSIQTVQRNGLAGTYFLVEETGENPPHRHLADILSMIDSADLPPRAAKRATAIFQHLAEAEARCHGISVNNIHFHEVGAADSIVDIVAACVALEHLGIDTVHCSPIPLGTGVIQCEHGTLPAPSPATVQLLDGVNVVPSVNPGEVTTPTAAAILTTLAETFGPVPDMAIGSVGMGAGTRETGPLPNLLRVFLGKSSGEGNCDELVELSANLDDCTGEMIGVAITRLLAGSCFDAWATPVYMKKNRPAWTLSALCSPANVAAAEKVIFSETTTFGIRRRRCTRSKLQREIRRADTPYGPIRVKFGFLDGEQLTASPELADCQGAADTHHVSVRQVMAAALAALDGKVSQ